MRRIVIIGTTGAGKTTLGKALAVKLGAAFTELDALHWHADWTPAPDFVERVERVLEAPRWVIDGNYNNQVQTHILSKADTVIWLDYSFGTKLWRLFQRTFRRVFTREVLWNGNTETIQNSFLSRHSIFLWFFQTHWRQRKHYQALFADAPPHLTFYRLYTPVEAEELLSKASPTLLTTH